MFESPSSITMLYAMIEKGTVE